jgi:hypothetical protein
VWVCSGYVFLCIMGLWDICCHPVTLVTPGVSGPEARHSLSEALRWQNYITNLLFPNDINKTS